jgi:ketosteroid isomerase-like protein
MIGALVAKKALAGVFEAMNRHDLTRFMAAWRDDGVFIYPGSVAQSGAFEGKAAVENWFGRFFEQFPTISFHVRDICVRNLFDLSGTNAATVHWYVEVMNRRGDRGSNSGITLIYMKRGKVYRVQDFIFDLGETFKALWEEEPSPAAM